MNLQKENCKEEGGTRWGWWRGGCYPWICGETSIAGTGERSFCVKREQSPHGSVTCTSVLTFTLLLGLPNEILMGELGTVGTAVAGGWWSLWGWH